jgi:hypothetical protein
LIADGDADLVAIGRGLIADADWPTKVRAGRLAAVGGDVHLGVEVKPSVIDAKDPDVLIVATGAAPLVPPIAGVDRQLVIDAQRILVGEESGRSSERVV